jgi:hypothetical protein
MESRMKLKLLVVIILLSGINYCANAQGTIQMISGKLIKVDYYSVGDLFVSYKKQGDKKGNTKAVDRYDVFSIIKTDSSEQIIYAPADSLDYTVEEARQYIKGEQAAHLYYKKPGNGISAAAVGLGSSLLSFYALPVPMIYAVALGRFNPKINQLPSNFDPQLAAAEPFKFGYQKAARNIKIQQSLKWGYISLGVGLTALIIYGVNQ